MEGDDVVIGGSPSPALLEMLHALTYGGSPPAISLLLFTSTLADDIYQRYGFIGSPDDESGQPTLT